jgi:PAS domain S-box-containing protein
MDPEMSDQTENIASPSALTREAWYQKLMAATSDWVWEVDSAGRFVYSNEVTEDVLGLEPEQLIGRHFFEFIVPEEREQTAALYAEVVREQKPDFSIRGRFKHMDGSICRLDTSLRLYTNSHRNPGYRGVSEDIIKSEARDELWQSELLCDRAFERVPICILLCDTNGYIRNTTHSVLSQMLGFYGDDETTSGFVYESVHREDRSKFISTCNEALAGEGREAFIDIRALVRDGRILSINCHYAATTDKFGNPYLVLLMEDITERKHITDIATKLSYLKEQLLVGENLEYKLKRITDETVATFDSDFARIWVVKEADLCDKGCIHASVTEGPHVCRDRSHCLHLLASSGRYTHIDGNHRRVPLGAYKIGRVATGVDSKFVTNDVTHDPRVHNHDWAKELGLVSFAGFRLLSPEAKPIGVLALFSKHMIGIDEVALLEDLANTTSHIILTGTAQEALQKSEIKYRIVADNTYDWEFWRDPEGKFVYSSPSCERISGYHSSAFADDPNLIIKVIHPDDQTAYESFMMQARGTQGEEGEFRIVRPDGSLRWTDHICSPVFDEHESFIGLRGSIRDITARKRAEEELREERNKAKKYFDLARVVMVVLTPDQTVAQINQKGCEVLGCGRDEIIGKKWFDTFIPETYRSDAALQFQKLITGQMEPIERNQIPVLTTSGEQRLVEWRNTLLYERSKIISVLCSGEDITERKRAEEEKRRFYRETILSATDGKLDICEPTDVEPYVSEASLSLEVRQPADLRKALAEVGCLCRGLGFEEDTLWGFAIGLGEAVTNAIKHASGGRVYAGVYGKEVWAGIADQGPGIESILLPSSVLRRGFSTKTSMGFGYAIMLDVSDRILLSTGPEGTTVILIKNRSAGASSLESLPDTWDTIPSADDP